MLESIFKISQEDPIIFKYKLPQLLLSERELQLQSYSTVWNISTGPYNLKIQIAPTVAIRKRETEAERRRVGVHIWNIPIICK